MQDAATESLKVLAPQPLPASLAELFAASGYEQPWATFVQDPCPHCLDVLEHRPHALTEALRRAGIQIVWSAPIRQESQGAVTGAFLLLGLKDTSTTALAARAVSILSLGTSLMIERSRQRETKAALEAALDATTDTILLSTPQGIIYWANPAFTAMTGYAREELLGHSPALLHGPDTDPDTRAQIRQALQQGQPFRGEILYYHKSGTPFWNDVTISPIHDDSGDLLGFFGIHRDTTETHALREQIRQMAYSDPLTALPNRHALEICLRQALAKSRRHGTRVAVGVIDLDEFKPINDTWGHAAGDRLLQEFAHRLQGRVSKAGVAARVGGDEFVIVLENIASVADLPPLLAHLHGTVEQPFSLLHGGEVFMEMSMGMAGSRGGCNTLSQFISWRDES